MKYKMTNEIKNFYYLIKRDMNKYILYNDMYYRIIGFNYVSSSTKGYIVIIPYGVTYYNVFADYKMVKKWDGINQIFLSKKDAINYKYSKILFPLYKDFKLIDKLQ